MNAKERAKKTLEFLEKAYPDARIILKHANPFQLLVATILAAQCTDERVNKVTENLFVEFPSPRELAEAPLEEIEKKIKPTGFYRNKAKTLKAVSVALLEKFGGNVPGTMKELTSLPGVGRKTAAIILGEYFREDALPVDTHVFRVSKRLGLANASQPDKVEEELTRLIPTGKRWSFAVKLGWHGRLVCKARSPGCNSCGLNYLCPKIGI